MTKEVARAYLDQKLNNFKLMKFFFSCENPAYKAQYEIKNENDLRAVLVKKIGPDFVLRAIKGVYCDKLENSFMLSVHCHTLDKCLELTETIVQLGKELGQESVLAQDSVTGNILYDCKTGKILATGEGVKYLDDAEAKNNFSDFYGVKFSLNLNFDAPLSEVL